MYPKAWSPWTVNARPVDARLVALLVVDHLGLIASSLAPAHVHAEQHLRPVFGVGSAGSGVDARRWRWRGRPGRRACARAPHRRTRGSSAGSERVGLGDRRVVVLGRAELQEDAFASSTSRVSFSKRGERCSRRDALAVDRLRLLRVVPEARRQRLPSSVRSRCLSFGRSKMPP